MTAEAIAAAMAADERRAARDAYRRSGGSVRRPLKSFRTVEESKQARLDHAANLHAAIGGLGSPDGFRDWLGALMLNPDLSPLNCALVSDRAPGRIVNTAARWRRAGYKIAKGECACVRVTAPGFKPRAAFAAEQVGAGDLVAAVEADPPRLPDEPTLEAMRRALTARLRGAKASAVVSAYGAELRESGALSACEGSPVIDCGEVTLWHDAPIPF